MNCAPTSCLTREKLPTIVKIAPGLEQFTGHVTIGLRYGMVSLKNSIIHTAKSGLIE